jgi:hypothetical protein
LLKFSRGAATRRKVSIINRRRKNGKNSSQTKREKNSIRKKLILKSQLDKLSRCFLLFLPNNPQTIELDMSSIEALSIESAM